MKSLLQTANQQLLKIAAILQDPGIRRSFLEDVAVNRALINAAQNAGVTGTC
ncbi:MAG: hypothetical protein R3E79_62055 [Caldilineaceae bacterium]